MGGINVPKRAGTSHAGAASSAGVAIGRYVNHAARAHGQTAAIGKADRGLGTPQRSPRARSQIDGRCANGGGARTGQPSI